MRRLEDGVWVFGYEVVSGGCSTVAGLRMLVKNHYTGASISFLYPHFKISLDLPRERPTLMNCP